MGRTRVIPRGETPDEDRQKRTLEAGVIGTVERRETEDGVFWHVSFGNTFCGVVDKGVVPKVGDTIEVFGAFGYPFHGYALNGTVMEYNSREEMDAQRKARTEKQHAKEKAIFEENRVDLDWQYDGLPPLFKMRIDRFRKANPDFRWRYEAYEMSVCTGAAMLAEWARDRGGVDEIKRWNALTPQEQIVEIPQWFQGHSGNTHQCAVMLAVQYLTGPESIPLLPGAMSPIIGSADYSEVD